MLPCPLRVVDPVEDVDVAVSVPVAHEGLGAPEVLFEEGVERPAQLDFLAACGEVSIQGFLVARPVEASAIIDMVRCTRGHLESLLSAAERQRAATVVEDITSSVRVLGRHRR